MRDLRVHIGDFHGSVDEHGKLLKTKVSVVKR